MRSGASQRISDAVGKGLADLNKLKYEDSLVERLKAADKNAAAELVDKYYRQIYVFMMRYGHSQSLSEDLTQECFIKAWQNIHQLKSPKALKSWLYRIALNVSRQYLRKNKKRFENETQDSEILKQIEAGKDDSQDSDQLKILHQAVQKLSEKLKQAIILHYFQHLTIAQAARAAGVRKGTMKSRLSRGLKVLEKNLNKNNGELK